MAAILGKGLFWSMVPSLPEPGSSSEVQLLSQTPPLRVTQTCLTTLARTDC